jgi:hypothetical protein
LKKLSAILLLGMMLFHLLGYQAYFGYLGRKADERLSARLEQPLPEQELFSIRVKTDLPPYTGNSGYDWVSGTVTYEGVLYQYVKRKINGDSIEYLCLPHTGRMQVESARDAFFRLCNDLQTENSSDQKSGFAKPLFPDYCEPLAQEPFTLPGAGQASQNKSGEDALYEGFTDRLAEPPESTGC